MRQLPALLAVTLLAGALPATAETLYRWVDEKGTVNYSSEPPINRSKVQALTQQQTPTYDSAAAVAAAEKQNRELQVRLDRLQREVDALKHVQASAPAPSYQAAPQQVASNPCENDPRSNCSRGYGTEYDYLPVYGYGPVVVGRPRPIPPFRVIPPELPGNLPARPTPHSTQMNFRAGSSVRAQY